MGNGKGDLLGAHISIAGGTHNAPARAKAIKASRWAGSDARASSLPLRSQCAMKRAARPSAQSSVTVPGERDA